MQSWVLLFGWIGYAALASGCIWFFLTCLHERRGRAARVAAAGFTPILIVAAGLLIVNFPGRSWIVLALLIGASLTAILLTLPLGENSPLRIVGEQARVDERDGIFHRFLRLEPGTDDFAAHYAQHPEQREFDDAVRAMPQLAQPGGKAYHPLTAPFSSAIFEVLEGMTRDIDREPAPSEGAPVHASVEEFTERIKGFARYLGADLAGTTKLNPAYVYSHIGRSPGPWGAPIALEHTHAVAIGVEMRHEMIRHAPDSPTLAASARGYFETGKVALLVARYINRLGYEARAHVDGNYRVLCGPIAVDAGLGELGRLGLLMTPRFGPSLRLSVVTTTLPLAQDEPIGFGVQDFCAICRKCARNCPAGAIPAGEKGVHRGVEKWQSDQETCYRFWRAQGTDCAICIKVCPYAHPRTPLHNLVRKLIARNRLARRAALWGDDLFYGRRPKDRSAPPPWHAKTQD
ncbi:MAG: reductive dehalogenase domain-containing protein [Planctomycetota bacterium]|nr:reductive dehalogenase domain-containing protein [Planctomycetota bacterium]